MAMAGGRPAPGSLIHHSDSGVQYACGQSAGLLEAYAIHASMNRVGNAYDREMEVVARVCAPRTLPVISAIHYNHLMFPQSAL